MSRAYRIKVQESLRRVIRASDHVRTDLEILEILPPEQMAELLTEELLKRGFETKGVALVRTEKGVQIKVEPATGAVTVQAQSEDHVDLEASKSVVADLVSTSAKLAFTLWAAPEVNGKTYSPATVPPRIAPLTSLKVSEELSNAARPSAPVNCAPRTSPPSSLAEALISYFEPLTFAARLLSDCAVARCSGPRTFSRIARAR